MERSFPLTALRLRFTLTVRTPLRLGEWQAGSNLRGALLQVMNRATCALSPIPFDQRRAVDPHHVENCPVCWLVLANEHPSEERRGYVLAPPLPTPTSLHPGEQFDFTITLFGEATRYLPYFVLAVPEIGHLGVGPGRGRFELHSIHAEGVPPLDGLPAESWPVLSPGERVVRPPSQLLDHAQVVEMARAWLGATGQKGMRWRFRFLTPLRLIWEERLVKSPDFVIFFTRLLERLDVLAMQFAAAPRRPVEERQQLYDLAARVRLVSDSSTWVEVQSGSQRLGRPTPIGGLVGEAVYSAPTEVWQELLPWLIWGTITQVGKNAVKGNGVFRISQIS